ncbi:hypothetical protein EDB84DRAFT_1506834, partial [Lactarius hengduanensis]
GEPDRHLSWLSVAHVALNHPFFWSHVDFTTLTPAGATEMLVRAKSAPLYLEVWAPKYEYDQLQPRGLVSPAPILEYLSLKRTSVADTLFNGSTPRLSRLDLRDCDISLKHLKINTLSVDARPRLSFWLDALEEIPQLKTLVLHSASPATSSFPFDVERTVTLSSLAYFDISASPEDCGLALAHLVLPALTSLCVTAFSGLVDGGDVERMLPYDTGPLQSRVNILAWPVPDIDVEVHDPPTVLAATLSPRVWYRSELEILDATMAALPLDGLVMLTAEHLDSDSGPRMDHFWLRCAPRWPLLRRTSSWSRSQESLWMCSTYALKLLSTNATEIRKVWDPIIRGLEDDNSWSRRRFRW